MKRLSILLPILAILFFETLSLASGEEFASKSYREVPCVNPTPAKNLNPAWIAKIAAWFVPMGSKHYYNRWAERLTNHSITKVQFDDLCIKLLFLAAEKPNAPYLVIVGGLKTATMVKCRTTGPHNQECDGVVSAPDYKAGVDSKDMIVATDNKTYLLFISCVRGKYKEWYVLTPQPVLAEKQAADVVKIVSKFGFQKDKSTGLGYGTCPQGVVNPSAAVQQAPGK